jgi:hypothetical protein
MPYSIDRYNGQTITVVQDGTIDTTTDIKLIGKNYAGYGEVQNENFLHLLENFSNGTAPPRPLSGQIWYDSLNKKIKFYEGSQWKTSGGAEVSNFAPTSSSTGDFWWDSTNKQLYTYDGTEYILVGPQGAAGLGTTQMRSKTVLDNSPSPQAHAITEAVINDEVVFIISNDAEFTLGSVNLIPGFSVIKPGVNLVNTNPTTGVTTPPHRYWGTASNALALNGLSGSNFVTKTGGTFDDRATFSDEGFRVGANGELDTFVSSGHVYIKNKETARIYIQTTDSGTQTPAVFIGANIEPGTTGTSNIGSSSKKYNAIYANTFEGTASQANTLSVAGVYRTASVSTPDNGDPNTIAVRTGVGDLCATTFRGTATSALFADLAEKYLADEDYEVGTVVSVGGDKEVTACQLGDRAFGAVSANPAFKMNDGLVGGTYIALKGRVPVKVIGSVKKGDKLIAAGDGCAGVASEFLKGQQVTAKTFPDTFAIALETNMNPSVKLVECIIL